MGLHGANWESVNLSDVYCGVSGGQLGYYGSVGGGGGSLCVNESQQGSVGLIRGQWSSVVGFIGIL